MALFTSDLLPTSQRTSFFISLTPGITPKARVLVPAGAFKGRFTCSSVQSKDANKATAKLIGEKQRRSANYQPPNWDNGHLQSLENEFVGEMYTERSCVLKEQVKLRLDEDMKPVHLLELIDYLQRLGISYHFEDKVQEILESIYNQNKGNIIPNKKELYETALEFRLLRQRGFNVPQEVFYCFMCENGDFKASLSEDTKGLLCLYEASFLLIENENTLESAREFAAKNLKKSLEEKTIDQELAAPVRHALELPLHWRMARSEARWFINEYARKKNMDPTILELAKLDFNIVQASYQKDLRYLSRWWKNTGFAEKYRFARDRLVECFLWPLGITSNPEYGYSRRMTTKMNALLTTVDDIYDVYGTLDELELFTDAVERWDIKAIDQLPDYMKVCFLAVFNSVNEMAYDALREQGTLIIPNLKKAWVDICRVYLQEAKWYFSGYTPTLQEYLDKSWISAGGPLMLVYAYLSASNPTNKEALECLDRYPSIIRCSAMILRLDDDLATSSEELKRGDVAKSIQCFMNETGASEEEARDHIRLLISELWKEMNQELVTGTPFSQTYTEMVMNLARITHFMYLSGDGHGHQDPITTERISALLFEPINLAN